MIQLFSACLSLKHEETIKNIYLDSFPPDERRDWHVLMELNQHPHFNIYSITNNNKAAGLITVWNWPEFTFIEHFAVDKSLQGKGIGSKVLNQLMQDISTKIILEIEEPNTASAIRRVAFYDRLGFHICEEEYYQPAYAPDKKAVKMSLMSYPDKITQEEFITIKDKLYKEVYKRNIT